MEGAKAILLRLFRRGGGGEGPSQEKTTKTGGFGGGRGGGGPGAQTALGALWTSLGGHRPTRLVERRSRLRFLSCW